MKFQISVSETKSYETQFIVEKPEGMSQEWFDDIIDKVETECKYDNGKSVAYILQDKYGIKTVALGTNFPDSPTNSEIEITDVREAKDDES
ncbi:hypothetical protein ACQKJG_18400 [Priestia megaterium]|uniref:hypothetical protein n=1 Tax=Priestia megaterium TaxID=1404 RepID=UPI003CFF1D29